MGSETRLTKRRNKRNHLGDTPPDTGTDHYRKVNRTIDAQMVVVGGISIAAGTADFPEPIGAQPVIILNFHDVNGNVFPAFAYPGSDAEFDGLAENIFKAVQDAKQLRGQPLPVQLQQKVCQGCGIKIFGPVAARGFCYGCLPEDGDLDNQGEL